jgi:hypothetical protein
VACGRRRSRARCAIARREAFFTHRLQLQAFLNKTNGNQ